MARPTKQQSQRRAEVEDAAVHLGQLLQHQQFARLRARQELSQRTTQANIEELLRELNGIEYHGQRLFEFIRSEIKRKGRE